jgi:MoxR-like ATPase
VIDAQRVAHPLGTLQPVVTLDEIAEIQDAVASVYVDPLLGAWIVSLVRATREVPSTAVGASVRGSLALERAVRAWALLEGRHFVVPEDVEHLFLPVVGHRVVLTPAKLAESRRVGRAAALASFLEECLDLAPPPTLRPDETVPEPAAHA